ncbi:MAG: RDD family protein [Planctomycetes bacterium]|nr:RDD family protein [Planctomycetota bacterium]
MADAAEQLDTSIEIVTPENIAFEYQLAGPFHRLWAYLFDLITRVVFMVVVLFALAMTVAPFGEWLFSLAFGWYLAAWFILEWFVTGAFEALWNGQTPGKRICHLRVLSIEGQPINAWQAMLRNFLRFADAMPLLGYGLAEASLWGKLGLFMTGLGAAASSRRFQRLGDLAADTMVVYEPRATQAGVIRITEPAALKLAAQLPANIVVNRSLSRALSRYVARRTRFSWQRRCEIAWHLAEPLREKYGLPPTTNPDLLLCAIYHRAFISAGAVDDAPPPEPPRGGWQELFVATAGQSAAPGYNVNPYVQAWTPPSEPQRR